MAVATTLLIFKANDRAYVELLHSPTTGYAVAHNHMGHTGYKFFKDLKSAEKFYGRKASLIVKWLSILAK
jgi:hypothetical protein